MGDLTATALLDEEKQGVAQLPPNQPPPAVIDSLASKFIFVTDSDNKKIGRAVATSSPKHIALKYLTHVGLVDHFDVIIGGDDEEVKYEVGQLERAGRGAPVTPAEKKEILFRIAAE